MDTKNTRSKFARLAVVATVALGTVALNLATVPAAQAVPECGVLADGAAPEAEAAVGHACDQLGTPYVWGGGHGPQPGPSGGGLDCSGLTRYAYYLATGEDIINGTTYTQWPNSRAVDRFYAAEGLDPLLPGDLLFFGTSPQRDIGHTAVYLGQGWMVEAPTFNQTVKVSSVAGRGYYGAIRLFHGGTSSQPAPGADRIAYTEGGDLWAKDGELEAAPEFQEGDVKKYQLEGDRVGVLTNDGALLVKEGDLGPGWHTVNPDSVTDFELDGDRIAFTEGQDLYVVEGEVDGEMVHQDAAVKSFQIEGDRVGVLNTDNVLQVKEGDLGPGWVDIAQGVTDFRMHSARIAYREGTALWVQEGPLDEESFHQEDDVVAYQLSGDRVAVQTTGGALLVKEGDLGPGWVTVNPDSVTAFHLDTDRIAYTEGGALWVKEGDLDAGIVHLADGVDRFQLDGDRIAVLRGDVLDVKEGGLDADWVSVNPDSVTSFQIGGDYAKPVRG